MATKIDKLAYSITGSYVGSLAGSYAAVLGFHVSSHLKSVHPKA